MFELICFNRIAFWISISVLSFPLSTISTNCAYVSIQVGITMASFDDLLFRFPQCLETSHTYSSRDNFPFSASLADSQCYERPLRPGEIRLLKFCHVQLPAKIGCELETVSLLDCPQYRALSYISGDRSQQRDIICNGFSRKVTNNLHSALRYLQGEHRQDT